MPTYEYKCSDEKCGHRFETPVNDRHFCPECKSPMVRVYGFATTNMPTNAGRKMDHAVRRT